METKETIRRYWRLILCAVLLLGNVLVWYAAGREDRGNILTVSMLDVGQGDAIFIQAPNGNQVLIDGGPPGRIAAALSSVLPFYDHSIDLLALSHPHMDHFAGLIDVLGRYTVGGVITSGTKGDAPEYKAFKAAQKTEGTEEIVLKRGNRVVLDDGVFLDVLFPAGDVAEATPHNGMLVMRLSYASTSVLFTGDAEENVEQYLVKYDPQSLKSDVLKVGHHGSKTSTSEEFLSLVKPDAAIMSLSADNKYGHPHKETLDVLDKFGVKVYRTDEAGTITLSSDGENIQFK